MVSRGRVLLLSRTLKNRVVETFPVAEAAKEGVVPFSEGLSLIFHTSGISLVVWDPSERFNDVGVWETSKSVYSGMTFLFRDMTFKVLGLLEDPLKEIL